MPAIPIYIISFNQLTYLRNTLEQFRKLQVPRDEIHVVDNASTYPPLVDYLNQLEFQGYQVHRLPTNLGHMAIFSEEARIDLPEYFALTDPDLQFSPEMPSTFREDLLSLAKAANVTKCGCALDISENESFKSGDYSQGKTIREWEEKFWKEPVSLQDLFTPSCGESKTLREAPAYKASIDTTFAVYIRDKVKENFLNAIRVAGAYQAKHLPWYDLSQEVNKSVVRPSWVESQYYLATQKCSTVANMMSEDDEKAVSLIKRPEDSIQFVIDNGTSNVKWWSKYFVKGWESDTFEVFRTFLHHPKGDTRFLDIGSWIGTTALWAAMQCERVYCVEGDPESVKEVSLNVKANDLENVVTVIHRAIHVQSDLELNFGPGTDGVLNASTSRILQDNSDKTSSGGVKVLSIDLETLCHRYGVLDGCESLFVKCDIEGGEENVLESCLNFISAHREVVHAFFVSMHLEWWNQPDELESILRRIYVNPEFVNLWKCMTPSFTELRGVEEIVKFIKTNPFESLLWFQTTDPYLLARLNLCRRGYLTQLQNLVDSDAVNILDKNLREPENSSNSGKKVGTLLSPAMQILERSKRELRELKENLKELRQENKLLRKAIERWNRRNWLSRAVHKLRVEKRKED